jgi:hypothetical protein
MISFLFLLATAQASEVFAIRNIYKSYWSETREMWIQETGESYLPNEMPNLIIYDGYIEMGNRTYHYKEKKDDGVERCYYIKPTHKICLDRNAKKIYREKVYKNGMVWRFDMPIGAYEGYAVNLENPSW